MTKLPNTLMMLAGLTLLFSVLALVGCNSGSPPTQILVAVTGRVMLLQDGGNVGQGNVTVKLTPTDGGDAIQQPVNPDGTFAIADVPAGEYDLEIIPGAGANVILQGARKVFLDKDDEDKLIDIPTVYVVENPPAPPPNI